MMEQIANLHLMRPEWLWCLLPAALLALFLTFYRGRSGGWSDIISPQLLPYLVGKQQLSKGPNLLPILFLAWIIAAVAAAGPAWKKLPQPIHQKQDALVLVLDLSYSMKAQDLSPSRMVRARQKLLDLLEQRGEGQTGLIAYAGDAHIVTPLTDDNATIANLIPALSPDMMPVPGSDPASAIEQAIGLLRSAGISAGKILLVTDEVDPQSRKLIAQQLKGSNITLAVLGIGTATGAPIPLPQGGFIKDGKGNIVVPGLNESSLRSLAAESGGSYVGISLDDTDLEHLMREEPVLKAGQTLALERTADAWEDQGYLLVLLLLPVALSLFRRGWVICTLPLAFVLGTAPPATAGAWDDLWLTRDQQGQKALEIKDNDAAATLFENPNWAGTAAYRSENFERAEELFSESETADSLYNRGNALARAGQLDDAIEAYQQSLELRPESSDAQENIDLLQQMKDQQEQEQEQEQDQDQDQDGDQKQDQNGQPQPSDESQQANNPDRDGETEEQQEQQPEEEPKSSENEQEQEQAAGEDETTQNPIPDKPAEPSAEDREREQAMEQWLRRIPDDPSGLLREKFRYESRQREQQGNRRENEKLW